MNEFLVRTFFYVHHFKMAGVPTDFLDRRQWQYMKRPIAANSLSRNKMNDSLDSEKNELLKKTERPQDFFWQVS